MKRFTPKKRSVNIARRSVVVAERNAAATTPWEVIIIRGARKRTALARSLSSRFPVIREKGGILELKLHNLS